MPKTYLEQLHDSLKSKRKRLARSVQAGHFINSDSGKVVLDILDDQVTLLVNKAFLAEPLTYEQYLSTHGAVTALRRHRDDLNNTAQQNESISSEIQATEEQIKQLKDNE